MILPKEKQVVSQQTAKRMKDLGFSQGESLYEWVNIPEGIHCDEGCSYTAGWKLMQSGSIKLEKFAALTISELGVILPDYFYSLHSKDLKCWACFKSDDEDFNVKACIDTTAEWEAESRGLMACYLKEQGLL